MPHVLLVDDDPEQLEWLADFVKAEGFTVAKASSLRAARIQLTQMRPDVLLTDLQLPDGNGVELVEDLEQREATEVVMITGHATVESAVNALRAGATDYLIKPVEVERLRSILQRVPGTHELRAEIGDLRQELRGLGRFGHMIGSSPVMQKLYDQLNRVSPTSATVLLVGESGTGKELAAQTIHDLSRRKKRPFLPLNCGAVSPNLIESELFGHEKGSFMRVGTNTPIATDVRVIAATTRNPAKAVTDGKLREDLYHRLNVFPIELPPLRERGTDIEILARHFLDKFNQEEGTKKTFSPAAIAALYSHSWPGNVRELKNYVQRVYILADGVVDVDLAPRNFSEPSHTPLITVRVGSTLEEVNRRLIEATLAECGNVRRKAAEMLGISLKTLYNRLAQYKAEKDGTPLPPMKDEEEFESELK